jgi:uncharacterized protein YeaO (DUF488 family)
MSHEPVVKIARVYQARAEGDGNRVLVDRVWPRGLSRDRAQIKEWCRQAAPSTQLRKWYGHDPSRFAEFARRYRIELQDTEQMDAVQHLRALAHTGPLTLVTATKALEISQAAVLAEVVREM